MTQRQIFLHGPMGRRHLREVLSGLMASLLIKPEPIWLVSPWLSNFCVLDNKTGNWDALNPSWGNREISFLELLSDVVNSGCSLHLVTLTDGKSQSFTNQLQNRLISTATYKYIESDILHTKGLLTSHFFLKGSMNFTYSGANQQDNIPELTDDGTVISEALLEFEAQYLIGEES